MLSYAASAGSAMSNLISPLLSSNSAKSGVVDLELSRDMDRFFHVKVRPLLDAVDQLRGLLSSEPIKLPTIVVVGDQSSGKSSVLEALSGVALPRGQNITTRCPLILRLINLTNDSTAANSSSSSKSTVSNGGEPDAHPVNSSDVPKPYAYLSVTPIPSAKDPRITNFDEIGARILSLQTQIAGHNLGVVSTPIYLSVYRANSPDLTLVDLPGITRNPIGDQPRDIYNQIKSMIQSYIEPQESVILNVMPATVDLSTCECVMLSKSVDPQCERTIGVITKIDLAEKGIRRKLENGVDQLGLALGVVAVRNRSQEEIDRGVTWENSREMEKQYFKTHPELSSLADDSDSMTRSLTIQPLMLGTSALAHLLTMIQEQKIRTSLPFIRGNIRELLADHRTKLQALPPSVTQYSECRMRVDALLASFNSHLSALCRGDHSIAKGDTRMHLSPRLHEIYTNYLTSLISSSSNHLSYEFARQVELEIKENSGLTLPNFLSSQVFDSLMNRELTKSHSPSVMAVDNVRSMLSHVLLTLIRSTFRAYPTLVTKFSSVINQWLDERQKVLLTRVEETLTQEAEMFTQNTYYLDIVGKIKAQLYDRLYSGTIKDREDREKLAEKRLQERERLAQQEANPHNNNNTSNNGRSRGSWLSTLSSVPQAFIAAPANAVANAANSASQSLTQSNRDQTFTFAVNDLTVTVDLSSLTLPLSTSAAALAQSSINNGGSLASLVPSNSILDMQINCYAYTIIAHKRMADAIPLLIRYHFVRALTGSHAHILAHSDTAAKHEASSSLSSRMQREINELGERGLMDSMKEDKEIAAKRERLRNSVAKLEKSLQVLESL